jgi:hypothetical protein
MLFFHSRVRAMYYFRGFSCFPARDRKNQTKIALKQREPVAFGTIQHLDHRRSIGVNVTRDPGRTLAWSFLQFTRS